MVHTKVTSFKNSKGKTVTLTLGDLGAENSTSMADRKKLRDDFKSTLEASRDGDAKAMERVATVVDAVNQRKQSRRGDPKKLPKGRLKTLLDKEDGTKYEQTKEVTLGVATSLRGQGRRSGGMLRGAMSSPQPYKTTRTTLNTKALGMSNNQVDEYKEYRPVGAASSVAYRSYYAKARSFGYSHDQAIDAALILSD